MASLSADPGFDPDEETNDLVARKRAEAEEADAGFHKAFPADNSWWAEAQPSQEE